MKLAILLSGGLDSTTALHWTHAEHDAVCAIAFDYGSNHAKKELACARWQAESLGIPYYELDISVLSSHLRSALLSGADAIPDGNYDKENMTQTVVPFRNGIFLSIAAGIAESYGAEGLVIAAHSGDHFIYPDCRTEFLMAMSHAISLGTVAKLEVLTPFVEADKGEITEIAANLGVDFTHTYSCYKGRELHCGVCSTCLERKQSFVEAGIDDPTTYEQ